VSVTSASRFQASYRNVSMRVAGRYDESFPPVPEYAQVEVYHMPLPVFYWPSGTDGPTWNERRGVSHVAWTAPGGLADATYLGTVAVPQATGYGSFSSPALQAAVQQMIDTPEEPVDPTYGYSTRRNFLFRLANEFIGNWAFAVGEPGDYVQLAFDWDLDSSPN
jgi:hypothetical protein